MRFDLLQREEAKHKQEVMLALQEQSTCTEFGRCAFATALTLLPRVFTESPFSKFPILGNRFILIRLLGKGGNGEVWDVIDYADNKRRCALKISTSYHHSRREHRTHMVRHVLCELDILWNVC